MKNIKFILLAFMLFSFLGINAQDKMELKAAEMTKEFSAKLGDAKLTTDQEQKVTAIYVEKMKEVREMKKTETDEVKQKELMKEINKKYAKRIQGEILTTDQKAALKANREKNKSNN